MTFDDIKRCSICKRMFQYNGYGAVVCPECKKEDDKMFDKVKHYLRDNPGKTVVETSIACEVPAERIRAWLKDERLEYIGSGETGLVCERCGKPIMSGTLCNECRMAESRIAGEIMRSMDKPSPIQKQIKQHDGDKMRFLGKRNK